MQSTPANPFSRFQSKLSSAPKTGLNYNDPTDLQRNWEDLTSLQQAENQWHKDILDNYPNGLSPENEAFVRDTVKDMDLTNVETVYIRKRKENEGYACSVILPRTTRKHDAIIAVNENEMNTWSDQEKRFIVGHEFAHIKFEHSLTKHSKIDQQLIENAKTCLATLSPLLLCDLCNRSGSYDPVEQTISIGVGSIIAYLGYQYTKATVLQEHEFEADRESAQRLNATDGGISFLEKCEKEFSKSLDTFSSLSKKITIPLILKCNKVFNDAHPSYTDRIEALKKL